MAQASSEGLVVTLPGGVDLHARPAADFVRTAMGFAASIQVAAGEREADAKSLLSVLALGAKGGTEIRLTASGEDAERGTRRAARLRNHADLSKRRRVLSSHRCRCALSGSATAGSARRSTAAASLASSA